MEPSKTLNVAIIGGGKGCKALMDLIFGERLSWLKMKIIGVADPDPEAVGCQYALEKGIFTTADYRELYALEDLHTLIEMTGLTRITNEIAATKPPHVRLIDNLAARIFWDVRNIHKQRIAERQRAEEKLRESEQLLSTILSASPVGIVIAEERNIQWANRTMLDMFGFDRREECLHQNVRRLYASDDEYKRVGRLSYPDLENGRAAMVDARFMRKDGSCFDGHLKIKVLDPSDPMRKYVATISDISWRKQAEQERVYREKLEGVLEMAGAACHELNQPLMAILAKSEMLMSDLGEGTPPYEQARFIKEQAERMGELTRKIRNIRKYKTMAYVRDSRIIDIHKASEDE